MMMESVTLQFIDGENDGQAREKEVVPDGNLSIINVAHNGGVQIVATCGERGRCRDCRVKILSGEVPPATMQDKIQLGEDEIRENFRLAARRESFQTVQSC